MNKSELRKHFRHARQSLSTKQQALAEKHLSLQIQHKTLFKNARNIAFYMANDGEISLQAIFNIARKNQKKCYLPCIEKTNIQPEMLFRKVPKKINYDKNFVRNIYGITQPEKKQHKISEKKLDIIFLPLVAFDKNGNRLGMGGGFYDRSLAFKRFSKKKSKPYLIGCAHSIQKSYQLLSDPWDIPLDAILTEKTFIQF